MSVEKSKDRVAIILPAYNESQVVGQVLDEIPPTLKIDGKNIELRVVVVNDGSTDATAQEVEKRSHVILIDHILNSGAGAATRTGLHYAKSAGYDYGVTMDSDGQHSIRDMTRLVRAAIMDEADFIIGSRLKQSSGNMPLAKKFGNLGLSLVTFLLLGVYVSDSQSGLKALNRKALDSMDFHSNNYAFSSEMIWKARQAKLSIKEVPIEAIYTDYSVSRGQKNITGALDIIKQLIKRRFLSFINE